MGNTTSQKPNPNQQAQQSGKKLTKVDIDFKLDIDVRKDNYVTLCNKIKSIKSLNTKQIDHALHILGNIYEQAASGYVEMIKHYAIETKKTKNRKELINNDPLSLGYMYYLKTLEPAKFNKKTGETTINLKIDLDYNKYYLKNTKKFKEDLLTELDTQAFLDCGLIKNFSIEKIEKGSVVVGFVIGGCALLGIYSIALGVRAWRNHQPGENIFVECGNMIKQDLNAVGNGTMAVLQHTKNFFTWIGNTLFGENTGNAPNIHQPPAVVQRFNHRDHVIVRRENEVIIIGPIEEIHVTQENGGQVKYKIEGHNEMFDQDDVELSPQQNNEIIRNRTDFEVEQPDIEDGDALYNQMLQKTNGRLEINFQGYSHRNEPQRNDDIRRKRYL